MKQLEFEFDFESEEWRDIPGFEGRYQVSTEGQVRSLDFWVNAGPYPGRKLLKGRRLKPDVKQSDRYLTVHLRPNKGASRVHKLVMLAFVGPCPEGLEVCHGDDNGANARLANLRYDTHFDNHQDRVKRRKAREQRLA